MQQLPVRTDCRDIIAQTEFFAALTGEQHAQVAGISRLQQFPKGEPVYRKGDPPDAFYVLTDGIVRFSLHLGQAHASAGEIIRCGEVFGWAALVEPATARLATAHCLTDASVLSIDGARLLALMESDSALGYRIMKRLNALISGNFNHFVAG